MLVGPDDIPEPRRELDVLVCWLGEAPMALGARYLLQHTTRTVRAAIAEIVQRLDINTLALDLSAAAGTVQQLIS